MTAALTGADDSSKTLPKDPVLLDQDSQDPRWGEVTFNHANHADKNYNPDGKTRTTCVVCHHTDQPKTALKPPDKTADPENRTVALTADNYSKADTAPVKTCRSCHLQKGDDSKEIPEVTYPDKEEPTRLTNENAYHINCRACHDEAIKLRPDLKPKIGGSGTDATECVKCHKDKNAS